MLPEEDAVRIAHMMEAANDALSYVRGRTREDLDTDGQFRHALVHCLLIIGEAANAVSEGTVLAHPEVEWRDIIGMRHKLIHGYYDVNLTIVWRTAQEALPQMMRQLKPLLALGEGADDPAVDG